MLAIHYYIQKGSNYLFSTQIFCFPNCLMVTKLNSVPTHDYLKDKKTRKKIFFKSF